MQKAYLLGLVAAGSLVVGATAASAANAPATAQAPLAKLAYTQTANGYPAPVGANVVKKRAMDDTLPWVIALGVGGAALFIALDDKDKDDAPGSP